MVSLTEIAHQFVSQVVQSGECVIDATCGNGHDTLFLAKLVGERGKVFACDVQSQALAATRQRCAEHSHLEFFCESHTALLQRLSQEYHNSIGAIMFNLGYLPGSDKELTTTAATTREAIEHSWSLLRERGLLSILAYVGHSGGIEEAAAVEESLLERVQDRYVKTLSWPESTLSPASPRLYVVQRL